MATIKDLLNKMIDKINGIPEIKEDVSQLSLDIATKITAPATAEVGQTIVVSEVDENGKPTAWEMADMASGGSNEWKLFKTVVVPEMAAEGAEGVNWIDMADGGCRFAFDVDDNGKPFCFNDIFVDMNVGYAKDTLPPTILLAFNFNLNVPVVGDLNSGKYGRCVMPIPPAFAPKNRLLVASCGVYKIGNKYHTQGVYDGGGVINTLYANRRLTELITPIEKICVGMTGLHTENVGFYKGATFEFYGR